MAPAREPKNKSSPAQTLLFAWVIVVSITFAPIGTYYHRTGNLALVISAAAAAFIIGLSLMLALVIARAGTPKPVKDEVETIANLRKRGAIFGKR